MDHPHHRLNNLEDPPRGPTKPVPPIPKYISLSTHNFYRHSHADCCQRLICFSCTFLFFLILLFLLVFAATYTILNPKLPKYKVSSIVVDSLNVNPANTMVSTEFTVFIEADNPNKRIGIWYRDAGTVTASFRGDTLCTGDIQQFLQPGNNITLMEIDIKGKSETEPGERAALLEGIAGPPPGEALELHVIARIPVAFRFDNIATIWRFRIDILFTLMLNSIAPGRPVRIESAEQHVEVDYMDWM